MSESKSESYWNSVIGRVNRHRLIALFVCVPGALLALRLGSDGPVAPATTLKTILFAVATYSSAAAAVRTWPTQRKQALAGEQATPGVWVYRMLSVACALLASFAFIGLWMAVRAA